MDDGARTKFGFRLCTNSFSLADVDRLRTVLLENFGIESTRQKTNIEGQYVLYILESSKGKLIDIVQPYIHPSMIYKLNSDYGPTDKKRMFEM
jgi:hypothetical protein